MNSIPESKHVAQHKPGPWEEIVDIAAWNHEHTISQLRRKLDDASEAASIALRANKAIADAQGGAA